MPEPINPSDHRINGHWADRWMVGDGEFVSVFDAWRATALAEAISQTFERDAINAERQVAYAAESQPLYDFELIPDPDTEIDRQARLIVDGEYRARAEAKGANNA